MHYQGHLPDGSGIQRHSAGSLYPCVLFAQQTPGGLRYGVISPHNQDGEIAGPRGTYEDAIAYAERINAGPDFVVHNHFSILVLIAKSPAAIEWAAEHLDGPETQHWGRNGTVVEPRYFDAIRDGIEADGLEVA